jgi:hypothetical protein
VASGTSFRCISPRGISYGPPDRLLSHVATLSQNVAMGLRIRIFIGQFHNEYVLPSVVSGRGTLPLATALTHHREHYGRHFHSPIAGMVIDIFLHTD